MNPAWQVPTYQVAWGKPGRNRYAVCVFVINEGERVRAQLQRMKPLTDGVDVVIADGGSTDGSFDGDILEEAGVTALLVKTGPGRLSAQMRMGLAWCLQQGYEGVVTIDGNGKDGIGAIPQFIKLLEAGYDHVQGSRYIAGGHHENTPFLRHWGVQLLHAPLISLAARFRYTDTTNGFRAYSRKFLVDERVRPFRDCFVSYELHYYLAIRAARLGFRCVETPVSRVYPRHGKTPTKISGLKGNWLVLKTLFDAVRGKYDPLL
ncbi:MAG: glycosyltransferase family 2 protein [Candidatus Methylacidiphilales bacterium]|nr:glycosyltransferase family 2 protein [Candidatus Methylacidiphilales bacterium]